MCDEQEANGINKHLQKEDPSVLGAFDQFNESVGDQASPEDSDKGRDAVLAHQLKNVLGASLPAGSK